MSLIEKFILPTLVIIVAGFVLFYVQQDKPDVRYSLSQRLPLTFSVGNSTENIQLLEIKNVGKTEAQAILIKSDKKVARFEIQKYSRSDVAETPKENGPFEIKYASLPPSGNFKLILMSSGDGFASGDFSITHSKGKASDAFSTNYGWVIFIFWGMLGIAGFFMLLSMKDFASQRWESRITYDADKIFKAKKPFYINKEKWGVINKEAWDWKLNKDVDHSFLRPEDSSSYYILSIENKPNLDDDLWLNLSNKASKLLVSMIKIKASSCFYVGDVIKLISIKKPITISNEAWDDISKTIKSTFSFHINAELDRYDEEELYDVISIRKCKYSLDDNYLDLYFKLATAIYEIKLTDKIKWMPHPLHYITPEKLSHVKNSDRIKEFAYRRHYETVAKDLKQAFNPLKFIAETDWSVLEEKDCDELKKKAYQKEILNIFPSFDYKGAEDFLAKKSPDWVEDSDLNKIIKIAENILVLEKNRSKSSTMLDQLERVARYIPLGNAKPDNIDDEIWQRLQALESEIVKAKRLIDITSRRNGISSKRISDIKDKLTRQLRTINDVLSDPTVVSRIEDYNNMFAPGNFENLKKVAYLLSSRVT